MDLILRKITFEEAAERIKDNRPVYYSFSRNSTLSLIDSYSKTDERIYKFLCGSFYAKDDSSEGDKQL